MRLAEDWGHWASDCAARDTTPEPAPPTEVTLTISTSGRVLDSHRLDLATGDTLLADVVPLFG